MNRAIGHTLDLLVLGAVDSPDSGFIALGAKADGVYLRKFGEIEYRILTTVDQYWQKNANVLSPVSAGAQITTSGTITAGTMFVAGSTNEQVYIASNYVNVQGRAGLPKLLITRSDASGALQAATEIGSLDFQGVYSGGFYKGARIIAKSGGQAFSASNSGSELEILTAVDGSVTLVSRMKIASTGFITFNEQGEAIDIRFEGDTDQNLFLVKGSSDRVGIGTTGSVNAKLHIVTKVTEGTSLMILEHLDTDQPFIQFIGTEVANTSTHISTETGPAAGTVDGPRKSSGTSDGFRASYMLKVKINNQDGWICVYTVESPT